jgi:hypothetical protein
MSPNSAVQKKFARASMLLAPCVAVLTVGLAAAVPQRAARGDVVTDWNAIAINTTAAPNSAAQSRMLAIAHVAMYDAARAVDSRGKAYAADIKAPAGASIDAAVAAAAHGALVRLVPAQRAMLDDALNVALGKIGDAKAKADGVQVGTQVAEKIIDIRSKDKADANRAAVMRSGPGMYQVTPPHNLPAVLAAWGEVTPFVIKSASGLGLKGPPALASAEFARDFNEVNAIGARNSTTRSADQTAAAIFWILQTSVPWHAAARAAAIKKDGSVLDNARLFALLTTAGADSLFACWAEKNKWHHWRPITAIRGAAALNHPALQADPNWEPLLGTPAHQEYPSGHSCLSGAAEVVLKTYFGSDDVNVSVTWPPVVGVSRSYTRFSQLADENEEARIWGGIHFRTADVDGRMLGRLVGEEVMRNFPAAPSPLAPVNR